MSPKMWSLKGDASTVSTDSSGKSLLSLPTSDKTAPQSRSLGIAGVVFFFFKRQRPQATPGPSGKESKRRDPGWHTTLKARGCGKYGHVILECEQTGKCGGFPSKVNCRAGRRLMRESLARN